MLLFFVIAKSLSVPKYSLFTMPLEIKRFTTAPTQEECDQLSALEWKIHNDGPLNSSWELYKGPSIEEYCRNRRKSRTMSAGTNSLKLITNENAEIIGSANWTVYLENHNQFTDIISKLERYPHLWPTIKPNIKLASQWEEDSMFLCVSAICLMNTENIAADIASMANQYYLREFLARLKHMNGPHLCESNHDCCYRNQVLNFASQCRFRRKTPL